MGRCCCQNGKTLSYGPIWTTRATLFFVLLLIGGGGTGAVYGREWRDILSQKDIEATSLRGGYRPGELSFEIEDDPFYFSSLEEEKDNTKEDDFEGQDRGEISRFSVNTPTSSPTSQSSIVSSETVPLSAVDVTISKYRDINIPETKPEEHNVFVRQSATSAGSRDIHSYGTSRTFVPPTESPAHNVVHSSVKESYQENALTRSAILPSPASPKEDENEDEAGPLYVYPENSVGPPDVPPRDYFNYDSSEYAWYGPGSPVISSNGNDLVVEYANNAWVDYEPPPPIPPLEAMAIANGIQSGDYFYWDEFGPDGFGPWKNTLRDLRSSEANQCGNIGRQSPIDVRPNGVACLEHHQIRSRRGDFRVFGTRDNLDLSILPNKLRVGVRRRPCRQPQNPVCSEPDPPHADFPHGWPGFADVLHVDFKFPAEHRVNGMVFDGEMQIYHLHSGRRRLPVVTVLMEVTGEGDDGHNEHLQEAINGFQYEYDANQAKCAAAAIEREHHRRRLEKADQVSNGGSKSKPQWRCHFTRNKTSEAAGDASFETNEAREDTFYYGDDCYGRHQGRHSNGKTTLEELAHNLFGGDRRRLEEAALWVEHNSTFAIAKDNQRRKLAKIWNPHHESLVPSIYFYGYDGSLTEPPCTEIVSWFVIDKPMRISRNQLEHMKTLLFTNVDGSSCRSTSAHYRNSVARPIQETGDRRQIWHCTSREYLPD